MRVTTAAATSLVLTAALVASAPAAVKKRQNSASTCTTFATGYLGVELLNPSCDDDDDSFIYAGIYSGAEHADIVGVQESLLVTSDGSGNSLTAQLWEFAECSDLETSGTSEVLGILRPSGATSHCIATETTAIVDEGAENSLVDSVCANIDATYTTWRFTQDPDDIGIITFVASDLTFTIGDTGHMELQSIANNATFAETDQAYGLYLLNVTYA